MGVPAVEMERRSTYRRYIGRNHRPRSLNVGRRREGDLG